MTEAEDQSFVGRADELRRLSQQLAEVQAGHSRTILIGGEAGVGKTRLLDQFAQLAQAREAHVLATRCEEYFGDPLPFGALIELIEGFVRRYGEAEATRLGGLAFTRLAAFFDLTSDSMNSPPQLFLVVRRMLDTIGEDAPVVLLFEDLHWADLSTLDLVRHLAQSHPDGRRLMIVCSLRSASLRRGNALFQLLAEPTFVRRTERWMLDPFGADEMTAFLTGLTGGPVDAHSVARCLEWSAGIPFYAEQLIAAGAFDDPEAFVLPTNLRDVVLSGSDDLSPAAQHVLRVASVAGRAISRRLLRTVSELPPDQLGQAIQDCFDRHILVAGPDPDVYQFRHALLRESVYDSIVRDVQVDLHIAMATALAAKPSLSLTEGSAVAEQASHWSQADVRPEALKYAVRAGEAAARTLAFTSAQVQYDRALALWLQVSQPHTWAEMTYADVCAAAAEVARWSGRPRRAVELARAAIAELADAASGESGGRLYERLATYLAETGARSEANDALAHAHELLADAPASALKARVLAGLSLGQLQSGHYVRGGALARESLTMARLVGAVAEEGRALNVHGLALSMQGTSGAVESLRESLRIARSVNHIEDLLRAYSNLGLVLEHAGELRQAAEVNSAGLEEARLLGLATTRQGSILATNASAVLALLGAWTEAEQIITELSLDRPPSESLYSRLTLAEIKLARGDVVGAEDLLTSITGVEQGSDPRYLGPLYVARAELELARDHPDQAATEVARGVKALQSGENGLEMLRLCAIGMRCAADRSRRRYASGEDRRESELMGDRLALLVGEAVTQTRSAETVQLIALCQAERQRIRGMDKPDTWRVVADRWAELDRRYPAAYARLRQAEAQEAQRDLAAARQSALAAHRAAKELGAERLGRQVAELAKRIRLGLHDRTPPPELPFGLSRAEYETLRYLTEGLDPKQVAAARGVSIRTVQTQQGRIYAKLDVRNRHQAIQRAREQRLFD